jgi:hypothetical protein
MAYKTITRQEATEMYNRGETIFLNPSNLDYENPPYKSLPYALNDEHDKHSNYFLLNELVSNFEENYCNNQTGTSTIYLKHV